MTLITLSLALSFITVSPYLLDTILLKFLKLIFGLITRLLMFVQKGIYMESQIGTQMALQYIFLNNKNFSRKRLSSISNANTIVLLASNAKYLDSI